jgi:hypothetical protein
MLSAYPTVERTSDCPELAGGIEGDLKLGTVRHEEPKPGARFNISAKRILHP